jgi:DNA-binding beta-propeller fold protein YncE
VSTISRRALVAVPAVLAGCRRKGKRFPGYAFVANEEGRSVAAVDLSAFALARRIALDGAPNSVIAHATRRAVYALTPQNAALYEIDAQALAVKRRARPASIALSMRLAADGQSLWMLCREPRALVRVPLDTLRPAERIRLPGAPSDFELDAGGKLAAVSFPAERAVAICDLAGGALVHHISLGTEPRIAGFRSDSRHLLVADRPGRALIISDVKTGKTVVRLQLPLDPLEFCFSPNGGELYLTGPGVDGVVIVWPYTTEVGETVLAGRAPAAMAVSTQPQSNLPQYLFVTNPSTSDVTVLDIETRELVVVVHVGDEPRHIVFTPDNQYALVLNRGAGDLAIVRIASFTDGPGAGWARRYRRGSLFTIVPVGARPVSVAVLQS